MNLVTPCVPRYILYIYRYEFLYDRKKSFSSTVLYQVPYRFSRIYSRNSYTVRYGTRRTTNLSDIWHVHVVLTLTKTKTSTVQYQYSSGSTVPGTRSACYRMAPYRHRQLTSVWLPSILLPASQLLYSNNTHSILQTLTSINTKAHSQCWQFQ